MLTFSCNLKPDFYLHSLRIIKNKTKQNTFFLYSHLVCTQFQERLQHTQERKLHWNRWLLLDCTKVLHFHEKLVTPAAILKPSSHQDRKKRKPTHIWYSSKTATSLSCRVGWLRRSMQKVYWSSWKFIFILHLQSVLERHTSKVNGKCVFGWTRSPCTTRSTVLIALHRLVLGAKLMEASQLLEL